jgi:hypothetical protein
MFSTLVPSGDLTWQWTICMLQRMFLLKMSYNTFFFSLASFELPENMSSLLHVSARVTSTTSTRKTHHVTIRWSVRGCQEICDTDLWQYFGCYCWYCKGWERGDFSTAFRPDTQLGWESEAGTISWVWWIFSLREFQKVGEIDMHRSCGIDIVRPHGLQQLVYIYIYNTLQYNTLIIYIYLCVCTPPQKKKNICQTPQLVHHFFFSQWFDQWHFVAIHL